MIFELRRFSDNLPRRPSTFAPFVPPLSPRPPLSAAFPPASASSRYLCTSSFPSCFRSRPPRSALLPLSPRFSRCSFLAPPRPHFPQFLPALLPLLRRPHFCRSLSFRRLVPRSLLRLRRLAPRSLLRLLPLRTRIRSSPLIFFFVFPHSPSRQTRSNRWRCLRPRRILARSPVLPRSCPLAEDPGAGARGCFFAVPGCLVHARAPILARRVAAGGFCAPFLLSALPCSLTSRLSLAVPCLRGPLLRALRGHGPGGLARE